MRRLSVALILFLAATAQGQTLTLPAEVKGEAGQFINVPATTDGKEVQWVALDVGLAVYPADQLKDSKRGVVLALKNGRYRLLAYTAKGDKASAPAITVIIIGEAPPVPPKPPGPDPKPEPDPSPAPIPVAGFRVLIVEESGERSKLPANQAIILGSTVIRSYLNGKCAKGPDGKTPEYRLLDKDVSMAAESKVWQDAMARPRTSLPWLIISNGVTGFEGPLPESVDKTLELLKKFGG